MKISKNLSFALFLGALSFASGAYFFSSGNSNSTPETTDEIAIPIYQTKHEMPEARPDFGVAGTYLPKDDGPLPDFLRTGIEWLAQAQSSSGGWGAGSHARQDVRNPHAVKLDPATTAFTAMAFIRAGNTLKTGKYSKNVRKALDFVLEEIESTPQNAGNITTLTGTQIQSKLGSTIDASMASQFLSRVLELGEADAALEKRIAAANQICVTKIQKLQNNDGSTSGGTWAGVLNSSMATKALEDASLNEVIVVDEEKLEKSRDYQADNLGDDGSISTGAAAGIPLYALSSTQRSTAKESREATETIEVAITSGKLKKNAPITEDNLVKAGVKKDKARRLSRAYKTNRQAARQINSDAVLSGFGNNGGEEFLSYMMTSESMILTGGKEWNDWNKKMESRLSKIQNGDGSWSGHHCITSPVFCTAAVVATLTVARDQDYLMRTKSSEK